MLRCSLRRLALGVGLLAGSVTAFAAGDAPRAEADAAPAASAAHEQVTITGTVRVAQESLLGTPATFAIDDAVRGRFLVDAAGEGGALREHLGRSVTVTGHIVGGDHEKPRLRVESFRPEEG